MQEERPSRTGQSLHPAPPGARGRPGRLPSGQGQSCAGRGGRSPGRRDARTGPGRGAGPLRPGRCTGQALGAPLGPGAGRPGRGGVGAPVPRGFGAALRAQLTRSAARSGDSRLASHLCPAGLTTTQAPPASVLLSGTRKPGVPSETARCPRTLLPDSGAQTECQRQPDRPPIRCPDVRPPPDATPRPRSTGGPAWDRAPRNRLTRSRKASGQAPEPSPTPESARSVSGGPGPLQPGPRPPSASRLLFLAPKGSHTRQSGAQP